MWTWIWTHITTVKDFAQTLAFVSAFLYFVYKWINGYLVVNTSMSVELIRTPTTASTDTVAITVTLERGQLGTVTLHDLRARVRWGDKWGDDASPVEFPDIRRLSYTTAANPNRKQANLDAESTSSPLLRLPPGEKVSYGVAIEGPSNSPCAVSAVALGRLLGGWKIAQWRASCAVAPRSFVERSAESRAVTA